MENGFTRIPNKLIKSEKLTCYEKMVCIVLVAYRMDNESCFPSRATIAKNAGINIRTVDKAIKGLTEKGFIKKSSIIGKSNTYLMDKIFKIKSPF